MGPLPKAVYIEAHSAALSIDSRVTVLQRKTGSNLREWVWYMSLPFNIASYTRLDSCAFEGTARYIIVHASPILCHIRKQRWALNKGGRSFKVECGNTRKSAHPPVWWESKMQRPWADFRESTVYLYSNVEHIHSWGSKQMYNRGLGLGGGGGGGGGGGAVAVLLALCRFTYTRNWHHYIHACMHTCCNMLLSQSR